MADIRSVLSEDQIAKMKVAGFWPAPWDQTAEMAKGIERHKSDGRWWAVTRDIWLKSQGLPNG